MLQQPFGAFSTAVLRFPKLLVAAVNGPAVGVGVTLLPHCDVVYAYGGAGGGVVEGAGRRRHPTPHASSSRVGGERQRTGAGVGAAQDGAATFWTPFFRLAIVPEFCSSVTFPEILVSTGVRCAHACVLDGVVVCRDVDVLPTCSSTSTAASSGFRCCFMVRQSRPSIFVSAAALPPLRPLPDVLVAIVPCSLSRAKLLHVSMFDAFHITNCVENLRAIPPWFGLHGH